ncbi:amidohydrolase family protein [Falsihalocynthiibacter sp. S25ZX9]|uniref:amidohydrolase family protein n=1 Tax=Falsihalocynthiibacter sp. S25ZX9 TaxID=3240870 RepID=UPI00350F56C9
MNSSMTPKWARIFSQICRRTAGAGALSVLPGLACAAVIIQNVTVVDTLTGDETPNMSIVIEGNLIAAVSPSDKTTGAASDVIIDGSGLFAVPGYNDMHSHALTSGDSATNLRVMLANGVTGYRQMSSAAELLAGFGDKRGVAEGPDLLALSGAILTGGNVRTPEQAVEEIAAQKAAGADFIKILVENPQVFVAALDAAEALEIPIAGHFPPSVSAETAAAHGMDTMEHLGPRESLLLSASSQEDELRTLIANAPPPPPPSAPPTPAFYERLIANPIPSTSPQQFASMFAMADSYDTDKAATLARMLKEHNVWQVPTLIRLRTMNHGDDPHYSEDPNLVFVTDEQRALWQSIAAGFAASLPEGAKVELDRMYDAQMKLTLQMAQEGVPMLAGSDYGGQWLVPGFSLHQEFAELAKAGLTPLQILQMTTLNAGQFLDRDMGQIAAGMAADLVLLSADPLADVANLNQIEGVVESGTYLDRAALDALLVH